MLGTVGRRAVRSCLQVSPGLAAIGPNTATNAVICSRNYRTLNANSIHKWGEGGTEPKDKAWRRPESAEGKSRSIGKPSASGRARQSPSSKSHQPLKSRSDQQSTASRQKESLGKSRLMSADRKPHEEASKLNVSVIGTSEKGRTPRERTPKHAQSGLSHAQSSRTLDANSTNQPTEAVHSTLDSPHSFQARLRSNLIQNNIALREISSPTSFQGSSIALTAESSARSNGRNSPEVNPFANSAFEDLGALEEGSGMQTDSSSGAAKVSPSRRPTLADLRRLETDQLAGLYQSSTVWNPEKDYSLMQDGPEQLSYLEEALASGPRRFITVVIDGDNLMFSPLHLRLGIEGGQFVYNELRQRIAQKHNLSPQNLDLRVRIFIALGPTSTFLNNKKIVRRDIFLDFLQGIIGANHYNYVVNVGKGSQAADLRVKAALVDALRDPGCFKVYLGGLDDFGYKDELRAIHTHGLLEDKVHLIQIPGYAVKSRTYSEYAHRAIDLDYLFKNQEEAAASIERYRKEAEGATEDLNRVVRLQPCIFHHLGRTGCQEPDCVYSHEALTPQQVESLRNKLKARKCPSVARGEECHFGDACFFSH
ncbi:hypothetical protein BCV70DRAFT_199787 [Testicularia cyperi]|uniref:C3H1-type domain-containing protein n=1 Tax=Testicularia cyperi TaxID=1882483 RepID=A0A317XT91_9BASI|nr:hypothetical protein BCV70DRAFT_199787 [Testicularia cyperi]